MLQIRTTPALLSLNTQNAKLNIEQPRGQQSIRQPKPELKIDSELPKVKIDQYQCFAETGLKNPTDLMKDIEQWSRKKWLEGIARRNREGDMLAHIEKGGNPIPALAENGAYPVYDWNIDFIPKSRPKIEVTGHLKINWDTKTPKISYKVNKPQIDYLPGKVAISMLQYSSVEIRYLDKKA